MGRPSEINKEMVVNAAESFKKLGIKNPSLRMIRESLGTGSNTTIKNHLDTWQKSQLPKVENVEEHLDEGFVKTVTKYIQDQNQLATIDLREDIEEKESEMRDILEEFKVISEQLNNVTQALENKNSEFHQLLGRFEQLKTSEQKLSKELIGEKKMSEELKIKVAVFEEKIRSMTETLASTKASLVDKEQRLVLAEMKQKLKNDFAKLGEE